MKFQLQCAADQLPALRDGYMRDGAAEDEKALAAGRRIASGERSRAHLMTVFEWKTGGRGRSRLKNNTDAEIDDALRLALDAKTERAALAVIVGLSGVAIPVGSAILTCLDPARYTVIDFRALTALGRKSVAPSVGFYLRYLIECRALAEQHGMTLRDLDRALWQWSKEQHLTSAPPC